MIPLSEFEQHLENISFPVAVAVSGGPDSLALLLLAHDLAQKRGSHVVALTVDHGLRPESKEEALMVGKWAQQHGIQHVILDWMGDKPQSHLQETARKARYALLTDWCHQHQIKTLLLGHHQQDQEETFWLRLSAGSGLTGLSGIKKRTIKNGILCLRPLLGFPKERLKDTLRAKGQLWIEDPSNHKDRFFRGRLRQFLHEEGLTSSRLEQVIKKLQIDADFIHHELEKIIIQTAQTHESGYLSIDKHDFHTLHPAMAQRFLSFLIQWFSPSDYAPRLSQISNVIGKINAGKSFTTGGIYWQITPRKILLFREQRAAQQALQLSATHGKILWDQRFWIDEDLKNHVPIETILAPLGNVKLEAVRPERRYEAPKSKEEPHISSFDSGPKGPTLRTNGLLPACALPTLPALWLKGKVVAVPHLCYSSIECAEDMKKFISLKPLFHNSLTFTI